MEKKFLAGILCGVLLLLIFSVPVFAESRQIIEVILGRVNLIVNGIEIDKEVLLYDEATYFSLEEMAEILGMDVEWDADTKTVRLSKIIIDFSQDDDLFTDKITAKTIDDWKKSFEYVIEYYPEWARYVNNVHFVNDLDANFAISYSNYKMQSYGTIKIKVGNNPIGNPTTITFHEIAHIIDTYDDLATRIDYAAYTGIYSSYKVDNKNFYEIWSELDDENRLSNQIREAFAIAVGRSMYNRINKDTGKSHFVPDALLSYMEQFICDITEGRKTILNKLNSNMDFINNESGAE